METPYKISSRALLPPALRTGKFTIECPCPDAFRGGCLLAASPPITALDSRYSSFAGSLPIHLPWHSGLLVPPQWYWYSFLSPGLRP
jgi:hypothetical protein